MHIRHHLGLINVLNGNNSTKQQVMVLTYTQAVICTPLAVRNTPSKGIHLRVQLLHPKV